MWLFHKAIFLRSLVDTPALVSSNWVAVCLSVLVLIATFAIRVRRQESYKKAAAFRQRLYAMRDQWKQNLRDSVGVTIIGWLILFGASFSKTVYADHQQLTARVGTVVEEKDAADRQRDVLKTDNERLRTQVLHKEVDSPEPKDSLRRRTFALAKDVSAFVADRFEHRPPDAWPNSSDPNPTEERKRAIKISQSYAQETQGLYEERYRDRLVGIVKEYESKGVPVRWLANDFQQRPPAIAFVGSVAEGSCVDELYQFKELAYHVDAHDHLITIY